MLLWLTLYGLPVLFGLLVATSAGFPFPAMLLLVASGSFVEQSEMKLWQVLLMGSAGAIVGDQLGYLIGRIGGRSLVRSITTRMGGADQIRRAEEFSKRWGGAGVFLSRWLVTPLGPWINVTSGLAEYSWPRFVLWGALGEVLWVVIYVMLGIVFSDQVQNLVDVLGNLAWAILGALATIIMGWIVIQYFRRNPS